MKMDELWRGGMTGSRRVGYPSCSCTFATRRPLADKNSRWQTKQPSTTVGAARTQSTDAGARPARE